MKLSASLFGNIGPARPQASAALLKFTARLEPGQSVETIDWGAVRVLQKNASRAGIHFLVQTGKEHKWVSPREFADLGIVTPVTRHLATLVRSIVADGMSTDAIVKEAIREAGYPVDNSMNWSAYLNKMYAPLLAKIPGITKDLIKEAIEHTVMHELWENRILVNKFNPDHRAYGPGKPVENRVSAYLITVFGGRKEATALWAEKQLGILRNNDVGGAENGSQSCTQRILPISMDGFLRDDGGDGPTTAGDIVADQHNRHEEFEHREDLARLFDSLREYIHTANLNLTRNTLEVLEYMCERFEAGADKKELKQELIGNRRFKDRFGNPLKDNSYSYALATLLAALKDMITDPESAWYGTPIARTILNVASKRKKKVNPVLAALRLAPPVMEEDNRPSRGTRQADISPR